MNFDVEGVLAAVDRSVSLLERDGRPAGEVTLSRSFAATAEDVWDAGTNAERITRWFLPVTRRLEAGRAVSVGGQRGRHDYGVRTAIPLRDNLGVRGGHQLGGGEDFR